MLATIALSAFLAGAVVCDFVNHRIPNYYLLLGMLAALVVQGWTLGLAGLTASGAGLLIGFALFIPLYAFGGMAAGDVKLMAVVGSFIGMDDALWAGACSLIAGGILGVLYLLYKGQFGRLIQRYWAMTCLRSYIPAEEGDAARHRFPYAIAIATGTLVSLYWAPL